MGNLAPARSRRWRRHRGLSTGAARNTSGATTALRSGLGSTYRLALGRRDDDRPQTFRSFLCLRSTLRHHRSRDARSKDGNQAERRYGRTQPALDRNPVASIGVALAGMMTRTSMAWRKMTMIYEIQHLTARRRSPYPSVRSLSPSALAPSGRCFSYSCDIGAPRPTRSRVTYDRQQVSWLAGYRLRPPSQRFFDLQWYLWPLAIRLQLRGQPRICTRTCAHRIPLVSPCGHYQSQSWHPIVSRVNGQIVLSRERLTDEFRLHGDRKRFAE